MAWLIPALSAAGSIYGDIQQGNAQKAANATAQQLANQSAGIDNQLLSLIQGLSNNNSQYYQTSLPALSKIISGLAGGAGASAPGSAASYIANAMSPGALADTTGVNAGGLTSAATNYLANPEATLTSRLGTPAAESLANPNTNLAGVSPALSQFYSGELTGGIDPQFANNAQSQLAQAFAQSLGAINAGAKPGQNTNAQQRDAQNNFLTNSTNLSGQLAGESQQVRQQGAAGLGTTASNLDTQNMSRIAQLLQSSGIIDAQTANMLTSGAQLGTNYNQTVLGNQAAGAGFNQQILQLIQGFLNQGNQTQESSIGSLANLGSMLNSNANNALSAAATGAANAPNPFEQASSIYGNYLATQPTQTAAPSAGLNFTPPAYNFTPPAYTPVAPTGSVNFGGAYPISAGA